jgi:hypothetical protein
MLELGRTVVRDDVLMAAALFTCRCAKSQPTTRQQAVLPPDRPAHPLTSTWSGDAWVFHAAANMRTDLTSERSSSVGAASRDPTELCHR